MRTKTKVDGAGRVVIPKQFRDHLGLTPGTEVEVVSLPDGLALLPERKQRRIVRRGKVVAVDTGAGPASVEDFDLSAVRSGHLDGKVGGRG